MYEIIFMSLFYIILFILIIVSFFKKFNNYDLKLVFSSNEYYINYESKICTLLQDNLIDISNYIHEKNLQLVIDQIDYTEIESKNGKIMFSNKATSEDIFKINNRFKFYISKNKYAILTQNIKNEYYVSLCYYNLQDIDYSDLVTLPEDVIEFKLYLSQ